MNIGYTLFSEDAFFSGIEEYTIGLVEGLLSIDRENNYVIFTNHFNILSKRLGYFENLTIERVDASSRICQAAWENIVLPVKIKKHSIDIMHFTKYVCPVTKLNCKYIVTVHDTFAWHKRQWCKKGTSLYYRLAGRNLPRTDRIIAVSDYTAEKIRELFDKDLCVEVICPGVKNGIDTPFCAVKARKVKYKYSLPEKYLLYTGNIEPKKNIAGLIRVFEKFRQRNKDYKLVMAGRRSWKSSDLWSSLIRNENIRLIDYADSEDLAHVYKMADALICTSHAEGFGFPVLEAFACGVPVVSSNIGFLRQLKDPPCPVADPDDTASFSKAIEDVIFRKDLRRSVIEEGLKTAAEFTNRKQATAILKVYEEVSTK